MDFEETLDFYIDRGIDLAIRDLDRTERLSPKAFLIEDNGSVTSIQVTDEAYYGDDAVLISSFKDFGEQKMQKGALGYVVLYNSELHLSEGASQAITLLLKLKNDPSTLKTRIFYFPYYFLDQKVNILFDLAFSNEG